jgi:hypothetical protein
MMTDIKLRQPNDNNGEVMYRRSVQAYMGEGCSSLLSEAQLPGFVSRVQGWMRGGYSERASLEFVGLRGPAAAQVSAALESE